MTLQQTLQPLRPPILHVVPQQLTLHLLRVPNAVRPNLPLPLLQVLQLLHFNRPIQILIHLQLRSLKHLVSLLQNPLKHLVRLVLKVQGLLVTAHLEVGLSYCLLARTNLNMLVPQDFFVQIEGLLVAVYRLIK